MKTSFALLLGCFAIPISKHPAVKPSIQYTLHVDAADLSGWDVEIRLRSAPDTFRLAMAAHPEYDDRYWRYVRDFRVEPGGATVTRVDSAVWQVIAPPGAVVVRYRIARQIGARRAEGDGVGVFEPARVGAVLKEKRVLAIGRTTKECDRLVHHPLNP